MINFIKVLLIWLLIVSPSYAADNAVTLTAGSGVTMRTKDIGAGVQSPYNILGDTSGAAIYGTAGSANANVITVQGIASGTAQPVTLTSTTITGTVAVTQSTSPWVISGGGTAGVSATGVVSVQGIASGTALPVSIAGTVTITASNLNINNISGTVSLPTGASTAALQTTGNTTLSTIATNTTSIATSALQTTGNTTLSTIATNTTSIATAANQATANASLATIATNTGAAIPAGTATIGTVGQLPYPITATPYTTTITGSTLATTATLAGASSVTTYICGFSIRANATAAATGNAQVTGTISGSLNFTQWTAPAASGLGVTEEIFNPCIPASSTATSIAVVSAAPGSGGVVSVTAWGYKL